MTIQKTYLNQVKLSGFRLLLNSHAISTPFHFFGKQTNLFALNNFKTFKTIIFSCKYNHSGQRVRYINPKRIHKLNRWNF